MQRFTGLLGLAAILALAWLLSSNRKAIRPRVVVWGLLLQFAFAFLVLRTDFGQIFQAASAVITSIFDYASEGSKFVFGDKLGVKNDTFGVIFAAVLRRRRASKLRRAGLSPEAIAQRLDERGRDWLQFHSCHPMADA